MIWTCIAQMLTKNRLHYKKAHIKITNRRAFTLTELVVVVLIFGLFVLLAIMNISGLIGTSDFKNEANQFVDTLRMASTAARKNGKHYDVVLDLDQQTYLLREITDNNTEVIYEDQIIVNNEFTEDCLVAYVVFDDFVEATDGTVYFRVGRTGFQAGGKIILLDRNDKEYSVLISRIGQKVQLKEGDVSLLLPKEDYEIPF